LKFRKLGDGSKGEERWAFVKDAATDAHGDTHTGSSITAAGNGPPSDDGMGQHVEEKAGVQVKQPSKAQEVVVARESRSSTRIKVSCYTNTPEYDLTNTNSWM
jgi:hypothetical protein